MMPARGPLRDDFPHNRGSDEFYDSYMPRRKPLSPPPTRRSKNPSPVLVNQNDSQRDVESERSRSPSPVSDGFFDRLTKLTFNWRILRSKEPDHLPIQQPRERQILPRWAPLRVEKVERRTCDCQCVPEKQKKRRRWANIILIIIILYLLGNVIALNVRVLTPSQTSSSQGNVSSSSKLSVDATQCISQFNVNAPSNPPSFPCSSCLPTLQAIPSNFQFSNAQDGQTASNAIQFCGLQAIFNTASTQGQASLSNGGFLKDVKFCAWNGVTCDGTGRVSSIELTAPGIPSLIPDEIGSLVGLQTFQIVGDNTSPSGPLPSSFDNLTALATLHLESTGITALPDNLFASLSSVKTLILVKNVQMGSSIPSTMAQIPLQNLIITGQNISNPLQSIFSSSTLQPSLKFLQLSQDSLTGAIPASISSLSALTELHLDNNALQSPLPSTFPPNMQIITLSGNAGLTGAVPSALCSSSLTTCTLSGTGLKAVGTCGSCAFS